MSWRRRNERDRPLLVTFVDVAASVALYRRFGDAEAAARIAGALGCVRRVAGEFEGRLVKRSGDELLLVFEDADRGLDALIGIQTQAEMDLRIGAHLGSVLWQDGDAYGDTVNLAARLTAIARARQIVVSRPVIDAAAHAFRSRCERFERLRIRGVEQPMSLYQLRWEGAAATDINTLDATRIPVPRELVLEGPNSTLRVATDASSHPDTLIGRDPSCDLVIDHPRVSRFHATVEFHDGQFILRDHSTNGSLLQTGNESTGRPLRRAAAPLRGRGALRFGHTTCGSNRPDVRFEVA